MSPLQFRKQLRLQATRRKMLTDEPDAARARFEVGYESPVGTMFRHLSSNTVRLAV
jgi:AraC-like DNA-binding protein